MYLDPHFQEFSLVFLFLFLTGLLSRLLNFPNAVGFLLAGVIIGPSVLKIVGPTTAINQIGSGGVVLLLFFVGMELSPKDLMKNWKINLLGTLGQIILSVICMLLVGLYSSWPMNRILLLGFVISLSCTSIVIQLLNEKGISSSRIGRDTLGILVAQDIMVVPMIIVLGMMSGKGLDQDQLIKQIIGSIFLIGFFFASPYLYRIKWLFIGKIKSDKELLLLFCLSFAFTMALISGIFELSTALGAFVAGSVVGQWKLGHLFHESLGTLKVILTSLFFASVGLLLDLDFFWKHYLLLIVLTLLILITNTFVNAFILKFLGRSWRESFLTSSYLSQIGEFSFLLAAIGLQQGLINEFAYQLTIFMIFISIVLTPIWVKLFEKLDIKCSKHP